MAIVASRPVLDKSYTSSQGEPRLFTHTLALDLSAGTYTLQVNGNQVTAAQPATDGSYGALTTSAGTFTFLCADVARVALGTRIPPATHLGMIGWAILRLMQASAGLLSTFLTTAPPGPDS